VRGEEERAAGASRPFAEFTVAPFAALRAVRRGRANGLRVTSGEEAAVGKPPLEVRRSQTGATVQNGGETLRAKGRR
jgi:hypothetical protein